MTSQNRHARLTITLGLAAIGIASALSAAEAASEVVTGVISCTLDAPRTATLNGTNGIIEGDLICSSRPADGDCTEQIRRDLADRGCAFRRDRVANDEVLYFTCSGPRPDMIEVIDLICRRLNGF
jgi:hypothetical protein